MGNIFQVPVDSEEYCAGRGTFDANVARCGGDPKSVGAESYRLLALELLERVGSPQAIARPAAEAVEGASNGAPEEVTNGGAPKRAIWNLRSIFARSEERTRRNG